VLHTPRYIGIMAREPSSPSGWDREFESGSLQRRVGEPSVPRAALAFEARPSEARYPLSPRIRTLREIRDKIRPEPVHEPLSHRGITHGLEPGEIAADHEPSDDPTR
jgi:hypothetical protein